MLELRNSCTDLYLSIAEKVQNGFHMTLHDKKEIVFVKVGSYKYSRLGATHCWPACLSCLSLHAICDPIREWVTAATCSTCSTCSAQPSDQNPGFLTDQSKNQTNLRTEKNPSADLSFNRPSLLLCPIFAAAPIPISVCNLCQ